MKELDKLIEEIGFRDGEVVKIGYNEIVNFANQRVIEELDWVLSRREGTCDRSVIEDVEKRRDQLKQE